MRDTLSHLVGNTIKRPDATKFVFILNQMDTTARDDNPEEVVGAWQRALAQEGLTAGRFYCIYNPKVAVPIEDAALRRRYESKRDHDLAEIHDRMQSVGIERSYRITGTLEKMAHHIEEKTVPRLQEFKAHWRKRVFWGDAIVAGLLLAAGIGVTQLLGFWDGWKFAPPAWWPGSTGNTAWSLIVLLAVVLLFSYLHFRVRRLAARRVLREIDKHYTPGLEHDRMRQAFKFNTQPWHSIFRKTPVGWNHISRKRLQRVIAEANNYVQILNDTFTDPSGDLTPREQSTPPTAAPVVQTAGIESDIGEPQDPVRS